MNNNNNINQNKIHSKNIHPNKKKNNKKKQILAITKLFLILIFIILVINLIILGIKSFIIKDDIQENNNQVNNKEEIETSKYTKEEQVKLEKLDYINEEIDYFKLENIDRYLAYKEKNNTLSNEKIVLYVNIGLDYDFYTNTNVSPNQNTNTVLVNKYYYLDENYEPQDLINIDSNYQVGGKKLTSDAAKAFNQMAQSAKQQGYTIRAVSTYRSFSYQKTLYTNYANKDGKIKADTYSARAGYSEHQTGLAVDIDNANLSYTSFGKTKEFEWMKENAYKYGFILRYTEENEFITGYKNEPWHYRYVGIDIATQMKEEKISSYEEYYFMYLDK